MTTKETMVELQGAGYEFVKTVCGTFWTCVDQATGKVEASHAQLGPLIQQVAEKLGL